MEFRRVLFRSVRTDEIDSMDRRYVQRIAERLTDGDIAIELAAVVVEAMKAGANGFRKWRILDADARRPAIVKGGGVEKWLQRRAGLARHQHRVEIAARRSISGIRPC